MQQPYTAMMVSSIAWRLGESGIDFKGSGFELIAGRLGRPADWCAYEESVGVGDRQSDERVCR